MIDRFGVQRANQADIVGDLADVRQNFTEFHAAFAVGNELELRAEQCRVRIDERGAISFQQFGRRELSVVFGQFGFGIE